MAMVDALPYMAEYPYGCTEQTLNRFLPSVITQRTLLDMKLNLKEIGEKRTNLNAQEFGDDKERAKQWKRFDRNPVFDEAEPLVTRIIGYDIARYVFGREAEFRRRASGAKALPRALELAHGTRTESDMPAKSTAMAPPPDGLQAPSGSVV